MKQRTLEEQLQDTYLSGGSEEYLEALYENYLTQPDMLTSEWRDYFQKLDHGSHNTAVSHAAIKQYFLQLPKQKEHGQLSSAVVNHDQYKIFELINAYRSFGHMKANLDPLGLTKGPGNAALELSYYGFTEQDLARSFNTDAFAALPKVATLKQLYQTLNQVYCNTLGFEYMHLAQAEEITWVQAQIEQGWAQLHLQREEQLQALRMLIAADGLEKYLGNRFVGQKRFSLEGGDSLIPLLDSIIRHGHGHGLEEIVLAMPHRGRLNVLVNILGKETAALFAAFEGKNIQLNHSGDVKYHLGYSSNVKVGNESVHLALAFNPSHLEIVSPVAQGSVRSRQRRRRDTERKQVMVIQMHGDAAFAGQGVVLETFSMSQARWFSVGGSIHIVVNNQVGFTISNPQDARSTLYCTDIAKMVAAPILHVNADDPNAVLFAAKLAVDYRTRYKKDFVIDLVCYRRHGHNEADEPSATQPLMYKVIKQHPVTYEIYAKQLTAASVVTSTEVTAMVTAYQQKLEQGQCMVDLVKDKPYAFSVAWDKYLGNTWTVAATTAVPLAKLKKIAMQLEVLPEQFVLQPQVKKMMEARQKMTRGEIALNWGYAETLAYATLLVEGYPIRLCGQDACRGTFAHRHAVLHDQNTDAVYVPLSHVDSKQAQINIVDSLLSEEGVLAFEYGYATAEPGNLVIWEAQFGDFVNGAQVVIDQFISSGEQKWGRLCGLVLFLPHGFEGMGPEHSSARPERFLQLCAQENMQVCIPTTPAQIFHLLRRQMIRPYRKPLIVLTPKSLLRHPLAVSTLDELANSEFKLVIPEVDQLVAKQVERVVLCTGKVYYDLLEERRKRQLTKVAILRVEQLYPFPEQCLRQLLADYTKAKQWVWCQEEPMNQGGWLYIASLIKTCLKEGQVLSYVGRAATASPAVGYAVVHSKEQQTLVDQALTL